MRRYLALLLLPLGFAAPQESTRISFRGRVYADDTGAPARGANVTLTEHPLGLRRPAGFVTTDEHGAFMFADLELGNYTLYVEKAGYLAERVGDFEPGREIVVRLRRVGVVSGWVLDSDGEIIGRALVEVMRKSFMYGEVSLHSSGFAWTDDRGIYRVSGLAPGRYYVRASCDGYETLLYAAASDLTHVRAIDMPVGAERRDVDFRLHRTPHFRLSGHIIDAEAKSPARAAFLRAYSADLVTGTFAEGFVQEGQFQIERMKPGRYFLEFAWHGPTNNVTRSVIFPFEMGDADQTNLVLTAMPRVTVSGHLKTGKREVPGSLSATLVPTAAAINAQVGGGAWSANVKEDGTFEIAGVEAGEYRLGIHSGVPPDFFVKERNVTVDGRSSITGLEVELDFSAGVVTGKALDATGKPIPHGTVVLQSIDPEKRTSDLYRHVYRTSTYGEYAITAVVPGEYLLFAWRGDPGLVGDPDLFADVLERADRLKVDHGATIYQNATEMRKSQ